MFRVGQKVVCVDDKFGPALSPIILPNGRLRLSNGNSGGLTKGAVYTIEAVNVGIHHTSLKLYEITRGGFEPGFKASRFRPVVERKTDISTLQALLVPGAKIRESADA